MTTVQVLDPTNETISAKSSRAERLHTLEGATIGLIDNGKKNSDVVLKAIGHQLKETSKVKHVIYHRKPTSSHPIAKEEAEALAKQCDGIITGTGD